LNKERIVVVHCLCLVKGVSLVSISFHEGRVENGNVTGEGIKAHAVVPLRRKEKGILIDPRLLSKPSFYTSNVESA
jgi:hypothetical protein